MKLLSEVDSVLKVDYFLLLCISAVVTMNNVNVAIVHEQYKDEENFIFIRAAPSVKPFGIYMEVADEDIKVFVSHPDNNDYKPATVQINKTNIMESRGFVKLFDKFLGLDMYYVKLALTVGLTALVYSKEVDIDIPENEKALEDGKSLIKYGALRTSAAMSTSIAALVALGDFW